jgi:hypothetical protein
VTLGGAVTALDVLAAADADAVGVADAWRAVEQVAPRDRVREAAAVVGELVPDDSAGEAAMRAALAGRYRVVRSLPGAAVRGAAAGCGTGRQKILAAVRTLRGHGRVARESAVVLTRSHRLRLADSARCRTRGSFQRKIND